MDDRIPGFKDGMIREEPRPYHADTRTLRWLRLKRLVGLTPATPISDQEGQLRYDRSGNVDGKVYIARHLTGGTYEWKDLTAGGSGGSVTVQKDDSTVSAAATTLDFSTAFAVSESPSGEINIDIDGIPETVDLGSTPRKSGQFTIVDASLTSSKRVLVYQYGASATDDEPETDAIICVPNVPTAGQVIVSWVAIPGPVRGTRTFRYLITS